jgi:hypothetical protein
MKSMRVRMDPVRKLVETCTGISIVCAWNSTCLGYSGLFIGHAVFYSCVSAVWDVCYWIPGSACVCMCAFSVYFVSS